MANIHQIVSSFILIRKITWGFIEGVLGGVFAIALSPIFILSLAFQYCYKNEDPFEEQTWETLFGIGTKKETPKTTAKKDQNRAKNFIYGLGYST